MAGVLELVRGAIAAVLAYAPKGGELVFSTTDLTVRVGDGATLGGWVIGGRVLTSVTSGPHTVGPSQQGGLTVFSSASAVAVTMPQALTANNFPNGATIFLLNNGAGLVTVTPTTSTINGAATLALGKGEAAIISSNGVNYFALVVRPRDIWSYNTPTTGATITMAAGERRAAIVPAGTIATLTVTLPPAPYDGQVAGGGSSQIVTALTVNAPGGATVVGAPASLAVGQSFTMVYRATGTTWYPA